MNISRESLLSLEDYAKSRTGFRRRVLEHKRNRSLHLGEHLTLIFEDELTVRYQIQEMLRIEKTFEEHGIQEELAAYTPLVPDGSNLKATMMIEYPDANERQEALARLRGVERRIYIQVGSAPAVYAIADEDLPRENEEKTSAVHFLRFEFTPAMIQGFRGAEPVAAGVDHPAYRLRVDEIAPAVRLALAADFA